LESFDHWCDPLLRRQTMERMVSSQPDLQEYPNSMMIDSKTYQVPSDKKEPAGHSKAV
jgi:hypothetical protein